MEEISISNIKCLIRTPENFSEDKQYPVLIFLHGAGTRGKELRKLYNNCFFGITNSYEGFPFVTIAPLCDENSWFDLFERLKLMVKEVSKLPYSDSERIYLIGNSMGGYATWQLAMSVPDLFAAIVPICGGGMYWNAGQLKNVPVWAFHGAKDQTVLLEESVKMVDAVNKNGGNAKLTVYPENAHNSWSDTFSNPEVFSWLLEHKRKTEKQGNDWYDKPEIYG